MNRLFFYMILLMAFSCTMPEEQEISLTHPVQEPTVIRNLDTNEARGLPALPLPVHAVQPEPNGIYSGLVPIHDRKIRQTVYFDRDHTFRLQEQYRINGKDSVVITEGTWSPSNGFIWLYKDQVVRARYQWKDGKLQYYHPVTKSSYAMRRMDDIMQNKVWQDRSRKPIRFFAVGNEPFWNVEVSTKDSIYFNLADGDQNFVLPVHEYKRSGDTVIYTASRDSALALRLMILPYFCNDGMSDYMYRKQVRIEFGKEVYTGCGADYPSNK